MTRRADAACDAGSGTARWLRRLASVDVTVMLEIAPRYRKPQFSVPATETVSDWLGPQDS